MRGSKAAILNHLKQNPWITSKDAFTEYGITRPSARIKELRELGYDIDGSIVTAKIPTGEIFKYFAGGAYALLNMELTDADRNTDKAISVPIFNVAVTHVVIRLGDDSTLTKDDNGNIGANIELGGVDDD